MSSIDYEGVESLDACKDYSRYSSDLFQVVGVVYDNMEIKISFILFITFILLNTDIFADNCLRKISSGTYDSSQDKITAKGIVVSAMILSMVYILVDLLVSKNII